MLPLPNLDDRSFQQLVREARDLIPGIFPEWTDENAHDPGITLLEMLAWHIEMQQFQLDRLTEGHERKFLKLLGEAPRDVVPATTSVSITKAPHPMYIPYGTLLRVRDLPFETVRAVTVLPDAKQEISVYTGDGINVIDDDMISGRVTFLPFGQDGAVGSGMVITLQKPLPSSLPLSLWIELEDQEPDHRIPARYKGFTSSGKVEWSYWHEDEAYKGWRPLLMERDESYGLQQSGPILFELPHGVQATKVRALLAGGEYNDPPRVRRLIWNEVFAVQGQTICIQECFDGPQNEGDELQIVLEHALFMQSELIVQLRQADGGWLDIPSHLYGVGYTDESASLSFMPEVALPKGKKSIRVIAIAREYVNRIYLGSGTGISGQTFPLPVQPVLADTVSVQLGWLAEDQRTMQWHDCERVYDFDESGGESLHFIIDTEEGVIRFSDGIHGATPPASEAPNVRMISCRIGTGAAGNVKADTIHELDYFNYPLHVTNLFPAYGGEEAESLKEAMQRAKLAVLEPKCGITAEDIEKRVKEIPGLRIVRVKAISGYQPFMSNYPEERALGHISVVVVPYSRKPLPFPSSGMIQTVRTHLEPYRLLTTSFHIIPPEYIKVSVRAVIVVHPRYEGKEDEVREALRNWLQPYGTAAGEGWDFGKPIYKSDVYDIVHHIPGVQYIQDVWLMAEGKNVYPEAGGDIRIPPNGLAISGEHDIEFIISNS